MKFKDLYGRWQSKRLSQSEAAMLLGVCERTFRRYCRSWEAEGAEGLYDQRLDRVSHNAAPVDEVMELLDLFETKYQNYSSAHFYDIYRDEYGGSRSYNWVRTHLQDSGLVKKAKRRGAHRRKRARAAMTGMMLHQDGSTHEWVPGKKWDLIITMDDADSTIYSGFFVEEEGTLSSFQGVQEVIENYGLFCSFYSDRGSHYWNTPKTGGKVDKKNPTQFGRAMATLGIEMIAAYSPEARGRSERMFRTLQDRLVKDLANANITEMDAANAYLKEHYWDKHNKRFSVKPGEEESAFIPMLNPGMSLQDILCIQEKRTVGNDNTVSYKGKILQIPKHKHRCNFVKVKVRVHEYANGQLAIFHGPRKLGEYCVQGEILVKQKESNAA